MMQIPKKQSIISAKTKGRVAVNPCCFREKMSLPPILLNQAILSYAVALVVSEA